MFILLAVLHLLSRLLLEIRLEGKRLDRYMKAVSLIILKVHEAAHLAEAGFQLNARMVLQALAALQRWGLSRHESQALGKLRCHISVGVNDKPVAANQLQRRWAIVLNRHPVGKEVPRRSLVGGVARHGPHRKPVLMVGGEAAALCLCALVRYSLDCDNCLFECLLGGAAGRSVSEDCPREVRQIRPGKAMPLIKVVLLPLLPGTHYLV
mmetsp:Transcript_38361/g.98096  ORF Transcript_38361/g.98096 Transcript_38361/m.98096 type:complete len:209 (+) Transcript_38361:107-733(+)